VALPIALALGITLLTGPNPGQPEPDVYQVATEPPRLLLRPQRLRLLQRERQRQSMRWEHFDALVRGGARLPEPGFALALHYQVTRNAESGKRALTWALGPGEDLRQLALVLDWCRPLSGPQETAALVGRIERALAALRSEQTVPAVRSRVLAAVAVADERPQLAAAELREIVQHWWRGRIVPGLKQGRPIPRADHYALLEMMHVLRDNLYLDLREDAPWFFKELPLYQLMSYYPASYPAPENEYRIPASASAQPDLVAAMLSRAAELAMVAYEPNAQETQYLQGWVMQDRFWMRHPLGITYEFLWANPYHPGLTYHSLPLVLYDKNFGRLFLRSSWEEEAEWLGCFDGIRQRFAGGRPLVLGAEAAGSIFRVGEAVVVVVDKQMRFHIAEPAGPVFLAGLKPETCYDVEVDEEEMRQECSDKGGLLALPAGSWRGIRLRPSPR